ncbi:MAG: FeoB-associated Cys-rich membrane protein [Clostridia bacterium]|nr:FeoB-associated Cys-rich membrane protein [Clostridia bacterium]
MNPLDIVLIVLIACGLAAAVFFTWRSHRSGSCCGRCASCGSCAGTGGKTGPGKRDARSRDTGKAAGVNVNSAGTVPGAPPDMTSSEKR